MTIIAANEVNPRVRAMANSEWDECEASAKWAVGIHVGVSEGTPVGSHVGAPVGAHVGVSEGTPVISEGLDAVNWLILTRANPARIWGDSENW